MTTKGTANTENIVMSEEELSAQFLKLFKTQYRGIKAVSIKDGKMMVYAGKRSAKNLLSISRDMAKCGFGGHSIAWSPCGAYAALTCSKRKHVD